MLVDLLVERVLEVGGREQRLDADEHFRNFKQGLPGQSLILLLHLLLLLEDAEADLAVCIHVRVVDLAAEEDLGWLERVVLRAEHLQGEHATFERRITRSVHLNEEVPVVILILSYLDTFDWRTLHHGELLGAPIPWLDHLSKLFSIKI